MTAKGFRQPSGEGQSSIDCAYDPCEGKSVDARTTTGGEVSASPDRALSMSPCKKCGQYKVTCELKDEHNGEGTYYEIECHACGYTYCVDGPDA